MTSAILLAGPRNSGKTSILKALGCPDLQLITHGSKRPLFLYRLDMRETFSLSSFLNAVIQGFYEIYSYTAFSLPRKIFNNLKTIVFSGLLHIAKHLVQLVIEYSNFTEYIERLKIWLVKKFKMSEDALKELIDIVQGSES